MSRTRELQLPPDVTADEAAAITAALEQWLAAQATAEGDGQEPPETWDGRRFGFAGRVEKLTGAPARVPVGAPSDPWTAMGRIRRD